MSKSEEPRITSMIDELLKRSSLYVRIKVPLEMQYLTLTIQPDRCCTDEESKNAHEWADKMTLQILDTIEKWKADGCPPRKE